MNSWRHKLAHAALVAAGLMGGMAGAQEKTPVSGSVKLDIQAQTLGNALTEFARQSGLQVMLFAEVSAGLKSPRLVGTYLPEDALKLLLERTDLRYEYVNKRTVAIRTAKNTTSGLTPSGQMRLTAGDGATGNGPARAEKVEGSDTSQVVVRDNRIKPFSDGNADLPRTMNDVQPYYIFDARTIDQSGAINVEDFLKQRLTMNTVAMTYAQDATVTQGNLSSINLRGLGSDKTLILVNGRRMAAPTATSDATQYQSDLNGIPLSAIDRIEVLPSSASGIYGGSAIGGVVNVILKRDYTGGEVRVNYDDTVDGDSAGRNVSASYGLSLEGGRTHLSFNAAWSDKKPLLLQDRVGIFRSNLESILSRVPNFISSNTNPWLGSLPNIAPLDSSAPTLTLKAEYGGAALNSRNTYVPANTAPGTSTAELASLLLTNAGDWNLDFPLSTQSPTGLLRPFGVAPQTRSLRASLRRQMLPWLELAADFSWNENRSESINAGSNSSINVPGAAPSNPFDTDVWVRVPDASQIPLATSSDTRSATFSALVQLPWSWTGSLDYTWSENRYDYDQYNSDTAAQRTALLSGELNPFVDTLRYPLDFERYLSHSFWRSANRLSDFALRGAGPLPALPWGQPTLTVGLERRLTRTPERIYEYVYPLRTLLNNFNRYYARESTTDSGYLEATVPLVKADWRTGLRSLELQLSGRSERYETDTGTPYEQHYYNLNPPLTFYGTPNLNNTAPYFSRANYTSSNYTVGLKYQPMRDVTLRVSRATAFLPPAPSQLIQDPLQTTYTVSVRDPQFGPTDVHLLTGGNASLKPQNSRSLNAGLIWEPTWKPLEGLRLNAEYYRIEQFDAIGSLDAQAIVDQQAVYSGRIIRNDTGRIEVVDTSMVNLYRRDTEGWDLGLDYSVETRAGRFTLRTVESIIRHLKNQYSRTLPGYDAVDFPSEGGAAKYKANATLNWESGPLALGWTVRYFGSYRQYGAAGGPYSVQGANGGIYDPWYIDAQGGDVIPSQTYHDLFVGYSFGRSPGAAAGAASRLLNGLSVQFGLRNVFDKVAPLETYYSGNYYMSPYGDVRLRSYWLSARMSF